VAHLYLDHDVSIRLAPPLGAAGHDATTARDAGLAQASDDAQLLAAWRQGRAFVTHNRMDCVLLHGAWRRWPPAWGVVAPPHPGILVLDRRPDAELVASLTALLGATPPAPLAGELYWWRAGRGWQRRAEDRWEPYP
jgi:hypothetical protein